MTLPQHYSDHLWAQPTHWVIVAPISIVNHESLAFLQSFMSGEEKARALKFRQESDRYRYILAHALKRFMLAKLLRLDPLSLEFSLGEKGKPLCDNAGAPDFNLSHSGDWVLCGVSSIASIGVDVELASREVSEAVASYALTPAQLIEVNESANVSQRFMLYWTQKEAISKALGLGLSIGFNTLNCSGKAGYSQLDYKDQILTIDSRSLENYVVSVATTVAEEVTLHLLEEWTASSFTIRTIKTGENAFKCR